MKQALFIKGKSAIHLARNFGGRQRNFTGCNFWARGYYVSTAGRDEEIVRRYIREQQAEDKRVEQLKMFNESHGGRGGKGWVKPVIEHKGNTSFDVRDLDRAVDRLQVEGEEALFN